MKISHWLMIAGAAWIVVFDVATSTQTANPLTGLAPAMSQIDNNWPGSAQFPQLLPATGVYLLGIGAIGHFTKWF